jgi:uncharacterized protein (TIGR02246 family)
LSVGSLFGDEAAVRQAVDTYVQAFNKMDLDAVSAMWAENGLHVDHESGERTEGRGAIRSDLETVFQQRPGTRLVARVDRVRTILPNVATVEGQTTIFIPGADPSQSRFTATLVQQDAKWLLATIEEMPIPAASSPAEALNQLDWLVGRWSDDSGEVRVDTTVRWAANRAFLVRSFAVSTAEGVAREGTQVIGWDPRSRQIRSWTFESDGSFGDGTWSKSGDDWLVKSTQTLADGRASSGTFVMSSVDENTLSVQLIGHEIDGLPIASNPPVQVVRVLEDADSTTAQGPATAESGSAATKDAATAAGTATRKP